MEKIEINMDPNIAKLENHCIIASLVTISLSVINVRCQENEEKGIRWLLK